MSNKEFFEIIEVADRDFIYKEDVSIYRFFRIQLYKLGYDVRPIYLKLKKSGFNMNNICIMLIKLNSLLKFGDKTDIVDTIIDGIKWRNKFIYKYQKGSIRDTLSIGDILDILTYRHENHEDYEYSIRVIRFSDECKSKLGNNIKVYVKNEEVNISKLIYISNEWTYGYGIRNNIVYKIKNMEDYDFLIIGN